MIWQALNIEEILHTIHDMNNVSEIDYLYIYRDSTYALALGILGPYVEQKNQPLQKEEGAANLIMSGEQIVVECMFDHIVNYWATNNF
ncbi:hypothetical protein L873DRAFT_149043 [Choiromyces venosus 120613-1]|uniref:Uncharacterized protein n=1 Tax=Choiromyces venosus 120613-1 TaxID=1336337 RepID=A0A3N4J3I7_9PEZI|nr:hypothetical protein L873DRAFT_149043 [Choiromyces venosus 120613-1]